MKELKKQSEKQTMEAKQTTQRVNDHKFFLCNIILVVKLVLGMIAMQFKDKELFVALQYHCVFFKNLRDFDLRISLLIYS